MLIVQMSPVSPVEICGLSPQLLVKVLYLHKRGGLPDCNLLNPTYHRVQPDKTRPTHNIDTMEKQGGEYYFLFSNVQHSHTSTFDLTTIPS